MKLKSLKTLLPLISVITLTLSACGNQPNSSAVEQSNIDAPLLKELFADKYKIGTALSREQIIGNATSVLPFVNQQFNAITPENSMKWERIHPKEGVYDFEAPDASS
ncbi:endo-1,4-beta-xylanase [Colwellia sp. MSW7]|uniref:Endo-1,4-beta-xylanase n=1 Tax=Colwellia maritima TaxID=2912588 RepID=A0ABS9X737_9GAMM|nr:endo-1,4-beta-xylanase [Colwellia maritima]MCI2285281.1 endo-1,4-beta-xylanase [Colwellia maritima]